MAKTARIQGDEWWVTWENPQKMTRLRRSHWRAVWERWGSWARPSWHGMGTTLNMGVGALKIQAGLCEAHTQKSATMTAFFTGKAFLYKAHTGKALSGAWWADTEGKLYPDSHPESMRQSEPLWRSWSLRWKQAQAEVHSIQVFPGCSVKDRAEGTHPGRETSQKASAMRQACTRVVRTKGSLMKPDCRSVSLVQTWKTDTELGFERWHISTQNWAPGQKV